MPGTYRSMQVARGALEGAGEAFAKMLSGEARFRLVITTGQ